MQRAPEQCPICGNPSRAPLHQEGRWTVYRCLGCGFGLLDPRPDGDELRQLYAQDYFDSQYNAGLRPDSPEMRRRLSQEEHRLRFFRKFVPSGRLVDLGCGMGYFLLAAARAGYTVSGVDISDHAAAYVTSTLGIPLQVGAIEAMVFPPRSMDVVTMWHFLEHTEDPNTYIAAVSGWLKDDGVLVIDVPNYQGTDAQKTWDRWIGWQLPYHFYHFTPTTIARLLERHGFEIIRAKDYHSEYVKERLKRWPLLGWLARLIAKAYSGTSYAVVARKKLSPSVSS